MAARPPKRFKSCKLRVRSVSTSGRTTTRKITLKKSNSSDSSKLESNSAPSRTKEQDIRPEFDSNDLCDNISDNMEQSTCVRDYQTRREKEYEGWQEIRELLLDGRIEEEEFLSEEKCVKCRVAEVTIRCNECGHNTYFCESCANSTHDTCNYFHVLEKFKDGLILPYFPNHNVLAGRHQTHCPGAVSRNVICIDQYGRQHQKRILFCDCEKDAVTLIRLKLWPGSASRPSLAFHLRLMELAETLLLECHVSLRKFCDVLGILTKSSPLPLWVKNMYSTLNSDSFDEFRYHQHLLRSRYPMVKQHISCQGQNLCPLCPKANEAGTLIESMDACFGLVRKKSSGKASFAPRHPCTMFFDQEKVDNFVESYTLKAEQAKTDCNEFKAGEVNNMLRSKGRNKLYDVKGVFGRVCRHDYPKAFMDIKHGERIAYSVFSIQHLLDNSNENCTIKVMYDIACTLNAHLKKNERQDLLEKVTFAIPIFHCYGHKSTCQIQYSPRRQLGYGLTDGEGVERLWSFLRRFSAMTKEMNTGRRIDLLTDALLHYSTRQRQQFGSALAGKLKRVPELMSNTLSQTQELFSRLDVSYDPEIIEVWIKEEEKLINEKNGKRKPELTWQHNYVQHLLELYQLRVQIACAKESDQTYFTDIVKKSKRVVKLVENTERRHRVLKRWKPGERKFNAAALSLEMSRNEAVIESTYALANERMFLISLKKKYADGQAIVIKLSKQITQRTNAIKTALGKYNASLKSLEDWIEELPKEIDFDEAKDPGSQLYNDFKSPAGQNQDTVPFTVKRSAIDLHNFLQRCKEEQELLKIESERLINYYLNERQELESYGREHSEPQTKLMRGAVACFNKEIVNLDNTLYSLSYLLADHLTEASKQKLPTVKVEAEHSLSPLHAYDFGENASLDETSSVGDESDFALNLQSSDEDSESEH
ncbi:uncharacterized protein LOC114540544 [Dendronephthya gigantea]|uniref:uncharacterized protein LOC114540544 n=1 Tax=Dendronephthya gigantea TaxID=151771 RepID=UPI00106CE655|nr:uncharacterized protein LOC114540544 [Dendronephthya gigantea]